MYQLMMCSCSVTIKVYVIPSTLEQHAVQGMFPKPWSLILAQDKLPLVPFGERGIYINILSVLENDLIWGEKYHYYK